MESSEPMMPVLMQAAVDDRPRNRRGIVFLILSGVLVLLVAAASWAPDSRMTELRWLPEWIARLADRDPNIRTAVPFIPLVVLLACGFAAQRRDKSGLETPRRAPWALNHPLVLAVGVSLILLVLAELGQVFVPGRTADVRDLLWGSVGIGVGAVVALVGMLKRRRITIGK